MAEGAVDVTIDAAPDAVWAKIGDFGALEEIFPGIESFRLEGDERVIGMGGGAEIRERLLARGRGHPYPHVFGHSGSTTRAAPGHDHGRTCRQRLQGDVGL